MLWGTQTYKTGSLRTLWGHPWCFPLFQLHTQSVTDVSWSCLLQVSLAVPSSLTLQLLIFVVCWVVLYCVPSSPLKQGCQRAYLIHSPIVAPVTWSGWSQSVALTTNLEWSRVFIRNADSWALAQTSGGAAWASAFKHTPQMLLFYTEIFRSSAYRTKIKLFSWAYKVCLPYTLYSGRC